MTVVPDHYRFPVTVDSGFGRIRHSSLDISEVELGRDRGGPGSDRRARLPDADETRLHARERRWAETVRLRRRELRPLLDRLLPTG